MKFTLALVGAAAASTETGLKMLQQLNSMDQSIDNMQNVKVALVQCAAAGDCSAEAAAMPTLAMSTASTDETDAKKDVKTVETTADKDVDAWKACVAKNGSGATGDKACAKEKVAAFNGDEVKYWTQEKQMHCVDNMKVVPGYTAGKENTDPAPTDEQKAHHLKLEGECNVAKAGLKVASSGDMPWIIVGSVVGLVCVAGAVICYCKRDKDE